MGDLFRIRFIASTTSGHQTCFGQVAFLVEVCTGHGVCAARDDCQCFGGYFGHVCDDFSCDGISWKSNNTLLCSGHGQCLQPNVCQCDTQFAGLYCNEFDCFGVNRTNACFGHGVCTDPNVCVCQNGYSFPDCESELCNGIRKSDAKVCFGHGKCGGDVEKPFNCTCDYGYSGGDCAKANALLLTIQDQWFLWFLLLPAIVLSVCVAVVTIAVFGCRQVYRQRKRLEKFGMSGFPGVVLG